MPEAGVGCAHQGHRGTRAIQRLVEFAPSTGGLALWVRHVDRADDLPNGAPNSASNSAPNATPGAPIATDGHTVFYGAAFEALPVAAQAGLVAHEVLHIALRHVQRYADLQQRLGDADLRLFNTCADAIIDSALGHLGWLQLPATAVGLDQLLARALGLHQSVEAALLEWDVERLYRAIDDRLPPEPDAGRAQRSAQAGQGGGQAARRTGAAGQAPADAEPPLSRAGQRIDGPRAACVRALGARSPVDLLPGPQAGGAPPAAVELEADEARSWCQRLLRAHTGDGGFSLLRTLIADLPRTRTPWEQVLRTQLMRGLARRPALSWSRPSRSYLANQGRCGPHRRMPFEPGHSASQAVPRLALVVDVSGSIDDGLMQRFAREIEVLTRRLESGLVLVIGDDRVQRIEHFEPGHATLRGIPFKGGGGTDFTPLLEAADQHRPDLTVVLTDLQGPARYRPRCPVVWAVPEAFAQAVPPFGRLLSLC